jgi:hypothetical protein
MLQSSCMHWCMYVYVVTYEPFDLIIEMSATSSNIHAMSFTDDYVLYVQVYDPSAGGRGLVSSSRTT